MNLNFTDILSIFVPHYVLSALITVSLLFYVASGKIFEFPLIAGIILYSIGIVAFNSYNMVFDTDIDKINKPDRPIPSGRISKKIIFLLSIALFSLTIILSIFLNIWLSLLFLLFFSEAILYSTPPIRLRKFFLFHNINATIIFALIPIGIILTLTNKIIPLEFIFYLIGLVFVTATIKDYEDIEGEKRFGIKTIPNKLGIDFANRFIFTGFLFLHLLCTLFFIFIRPILVFAYVSVLGAFFSLIIFWKLKSANKLIRYKIHSPLVNFVLFFTYLIQLLFLIAAFLLIKVYI